MRIPKPAIVLIFVIFLFAVLLFMVYLSNVGDYRNAVENMTFSDVDIASVPDGTYIGECDVAFISAQVEVTVQGGKIVSIDILRHDNDRGALAESVIDDIVQKQTTQVDAVSGATNSSKVLRKAVEKALLGAQ